MSSSTFIIDSKGATRFQINDPVGLRQMIIPILEYDAVDQKIVGLGTAFRIQTTNKFVTAQHLVDHLFVGDPPRLTSKNGIIGFLWPGLVWGSPLAPAECIAKVVSVRISQKPNNDPIAQLQGNYKSGNVYDCMQLIFDQTNSQLYKWRIMPPPIIGTPIHVGQKLTAIGFTEIGAHKFADIPKIFVLYGEKMYGAVGTVSDLYPNGRGTSRPWPAFEVRGDWGPGMSGGPVFTEAGEVVGLVSSGITGGNEDEARGYGLWFQSAKILMDWVT